MKLQELLTTCIRRGASDLHLNPGRPAVLRIHGALHSLDLRVLDDASAAELARALCDEVHWGELESRGTSDFGLAHSSGDRFRVSVLGQRGRL